MAAVPVNPDRQSGPQYIRSFFAALPTLHALVTDLQLWNTKFDPRRDFNSRAGQINSQLLAASITFIQLMTSVRTMCRVMDHHCKTYSIARESCPTAKLATELKMSSESTYPKMIEIARDNNPEDYRPKYARALLLEDLGREAEVALEYCALARLPWPGAYALMRAATFAKSESEAEGFYKRAVDLYPAFSLAQRALGTAIRGGSPMDAATHYANALSHGPHLEYGEQSWVTARRGWVEMAVYQGFRIYFSPAEGRNLAFPILLGLPVDGASKRLLNFWRRFSGLALMRFHKDKIWRRIRRPASGRDAGADRPNVERRRRTFFSILEPLWLVVDPPLRRWVVHHYRYFQFALEGNDVNDIKEQIDRIHERWMKGSLPTGTRE